MNKIDRQINLLLNNEKNNISIPDKYNTMIYETLRNLPERNVVKIKRSETNNRSKTKILVAAACCTMFLTTGIVFADEITRAVKNIFNYSKGVEKAIENDYIEVPAQQIAESNGINIEVKNFLMDDYDLSFTFKVHVEDTELFNKISNINLNDMIITDEENNILYCEDKEKFDKYCQTNNFNYTFGEYNEKYFETEYENYISNQNENTIYLIYNLNADKFPKSKSINIDVSNIKFELTENTEAISNGDWNLKLDVPEKFYNRECEIYTVESCNNPNVLVTDFSVYNTGTNISLEMNTKSDLNKDINDEETFKNWYKELRKSKKKIVTEFYLQDELGNKYFPVENSSDDGIIHYEMDGNIIVNQKFDFTTYDGLGRMKLYIKFNLYDQESNAEVELKNNAKL